MRMNPKQFEIELMPGVESDWKIGSDQFKLRLGIELDKKLDSDLFKLKSQIKSDWVGSIFKQFALKKI